MIENTATATQEPVPTSQDKPVEPKNAKKSFNWTAAIGIVGAVAGVLALPASFWIANRQQAVKRLRYEIISSGPIVSVTDNVNGRLKVTFDKTVVPDAKFAVVRVSNDGNQPVLAEDFKVPLAFHFGMDRKSSVLDASVTATVPSDVAASVAKQDDTVSMVPSLLNPNENVTIKVLYTGGDEHVRATGRIVGATISKPDVSPGTPQTNSLWFSVLTPIFGLIFGSLAAVIPLQLLTERRLKSQLKDEQDRFLKLANSFSEASKRP